MRSSPVGLAARRASRRSRRRSGRRPAPSPPAARTSPRLGALPAPGATASPARRPGSRISGDQSIAGDVVRLRRVELQGALERAEVLRLDRHRHPDDAAAEQRPDRPDRDLLDARRPVRAPVIGEERDLRVGLAAGRVQQGVHRLLVALLPGLDELLDRRAPLVGVQLVVDQRVAAVGHARDHHDRDEDQRERRTGPAMPPACRLGRRKEQRTGPGGVPERSGTTSTPAGHRKWFSRVRRILYPRIQDEHGSIRERRSRLPALVGPHRAELHAYCYRMLGVPSRTRKTRSRKRSSAHGAGSPASRAAASCVPWLYRIATNACLRSSSRQRPKRVLSTCDHSLRPTEQAWRSRRSRPTPSGSSPHAHDPDCPSTSSAWRASSSRSSPRSSTCPPRSARC